TNGTIKVLEYLKDKNLLPTSAIVAEPTCELIFGDAIKVGRRGSINGYIELHGKQGHAAYPEKSTNPIELIAPILKKMAGVNLDDGDEYFAPSKLVVTDIRAGMQVTNVTPSKLNLMFNVRNSTKTTKDDVQNFVNNLFLGLQFTLKLNQGSYPFLTNKTSTIVTSLTQSIEKILNIKPKHSTAGGTSDARLFSAFGVNSVEFGVLNDKIHGIDESTTIDEVVVLKNIFNDVIKGF
ncbi:MAG: M20/M25/M40 family metallo-hydrolase, partial [Arcobacter sp.]|nr:M20/M25/M40 family metallo-hydrolase [Arcobacter sp.]